MMSNDVSPLPDTEVHYLRSEHVGDEFKIFVGHPHPSETAPPSVLFMGDPWGDFGTAVEMTRILRYAEDLPPLLVVAVGYRVVAIEDNEAIRGRDFTPTVDLTQTWGGPGMMGGASRFLAFLRDELSRGCASGTASTRMTPPSSGTRWAGCSRPTCCSPSPPRSGATASGARRSTGTRGSCSTTRRSTHERTTTSRRRCSSRSARTRTPRASGAGVRSSQPTGERRRRRRPKANPV